MKVYPIEKPGKKKKKKRKEDKPYQAFIRSQPCLLCGCSGSVHHHESLTGGSMGSKCPDRESLPLCVVCHHYRHVMGRKSFYALHKIDFKNEILRLQEEYDITHAGK